MIPGTVEEMRGRLRGRVQEIIGRFRGQLGGQILGGQILGGQLGSQVQVGQGALVEQAKAKLQMVTAKAQELRPGVLPKVAEFRPGMLLETLSQKAGQLGAQTGTLGHTVEEGGSFISNESAAEEFTDRISIET